MTRVIFAVLLWTCAALSGAAQSQSQTVTYPDPVSTTVNDFAGVLGPEVAARIEAALVAAKSDPGMEITLVTIHRRADYGPSADIESFAMGLLNAWGVGDPVRNDGIVILVAVEDREMRIALGRGYPPVQDGRALRVIDVLMLPEFREGRMEAGIEAGVMGVITHIARPFREGRPVTETSGLSDPSKPDDTLFWTAFGGIWMFVLTILAGVGILIRRSVLQKRTCPQCAKRHVTTLRELHKSPTENIAGDGMETRTCPDCGWTAVTPYVIASLHDQRIESARRSSSSSSSGSGGSFGGGSSGGGGASGRW